jgi:hypothetical protein
MPLSFDRDGATRVCRLSLFSLFVWGEETVVRECVRVVRRTTLVEESSISRQSSLKRRNQKA